ncbi:MAG: calcium-binding protein [Rickettsiales bacterium]
MVYTFTVYMDDNIETSLTDLVVLGYGGTVTGHAWLKLTGGSRDRETGFQSNNTLKDETDRSQTGLNVASYTIEVNETEYNRAADAITLYEKILGKPNHPRFDDFKYNVSPLDSNVCVDFVQFVFRKMLADPRADFVNYFQNSDALPGAVGFYADFAYGTAEEVRAQILDSNKVIHNGITLHDVISLPENAPYATRSFTNSDNESKVLILKNDISHIPDYGDFHIIATPEDRGSGIPVGYYGTANNDFIVGSENADLISDNRGNNNLFGYGGDDSIRGGTGKDSIFGGAGNDILRGGAENDSIFGGGENDTLIGGAGNDELYGDLGYDRFIFNLPPGLNGNDVVYDSDGLGVIKLGNSLLSGEAETIDGGGWSLGGYQFTKDGSDMLLHNGTDTIRIKDFAEGQTKLGITIPGESEEQTFTFTTTIDATAIGGRSNAVLMMEYTFDVGLIGTPGHNPSVIELYAPVHGTLSIDNETTTFSNATIGVHDQGLNEPQDVYEVSISNEGTLFGQPLIFMNFYLLDSDATMFNGLALPSSPGFSAATDFYSANVLLGDYFGALYDLSSSYETFTLTAT